MAGMHPRSASATRRRRQSELLPAATRVVVILIALCTLLTMAFAFYPEIVRLSDMRNDLEKQKARLADLRKSAAEREEEVHLLQNDPAYLEIIARDRLDLMKNGETIFRLGSSHPHS